MNMNNVILLAVYSDRVIEVLNTESLPTIHKVVDLYVSGPVIVRVLYCTLQKPREDVIGIAAINACIARNIPAFTLRRIKAAAKRKAKIAPDQKRLFTDFD